MGLAEGCIVEGVDGRSDGCAVGEGVGCARPKVGVAVGETEGTEVGEKESIAKDRRRLSDIESGMRVVEVVTKIDMILCRLHRQRRVPRMQAQVVSTGGKNVCRVCPTLSLTRVGTAVIS